MSLAPRLLAIAAVAAALVGAVGTPARAQDGEGDPPDEGALDMPPEELDPDAQADGQDEGEGEGQGDAGAGAGDAPEGEEAVDMAPEELTEQEVDEGDDPFGTRQPAADASVEAEAPPSPLLAAYPVAVLRRPLVLPRGTVEVLGGFDGTSVAILEESDLIGVVELGVQYGVTDDLQVRFVYPLGVLNAGGDGNLQEDHAHFTVGAARRVYRSGPLEVLAALDLSFDFDRDDTLAGDPLLARTGGISLGAPARYRVGERLAVLAGGRLVNVFVNGVPDEMGLATGVTIPIDVGLGYQIDDHAFARLDTTLVTLGVATIDTTHIVDVTPVLVGGGYSFDSALDIVAGFGFTDVQHAGDTWAFTVGAAWRRFR